MEAYFNEIEYLREKPDIKAIIWKVQHIKLEDWEKIPLKNIAIAIKEDVNMPDFAADFGIELIKREKFRSLR